MKDVRFRSAYAALGAGISPADVLGFHRSTFGDARMDAAGDGGGEGEQPDDPSADQAKGDNPDGKADDGKGGKSAILADLASERDKRQALERTVNELKSGLLKALGVEEKSDKDDAASVIATLTERLDAMSTESAVEKLARKHGIADDDDIALLTSVKDDEARAKMAARLAPKKDDAGGEKPSGWRTPRPDRSAGKGGSGSEARATSVTQVMDDRRAAREKKS